VFSCRGTKSRGVFPCHGSLLSKDVRLLVFRAFYLKSCRLSCGWLRDFLLDVSRGLQNRLVVCKIVLSCGIKPRYGFRVIVCAFKDARFSDVLSYVLLAAALGWPFFAGTFLVVCKFVLAVVLFFSRGRFSSYGVVLLVLSLIKLCYFCSAITYGIASELILFRDLRDFLRSSASLCLFFFS